MAERRPIAIGLGELLWDVLPEGRQLGGAPFNFARHCSQLGLNGFPVSRVGADSLGEETFQLLEHWGVETGFVSKDPIYPTGTVQVTFDSAGSPDYEIGANAAWDYLELGDALLELAPQVKIVCFGTLAQRNLQSRKSIHAFLDLVPDSALKLFDVNLRQDYYSLPVLEASLERANMLKLSDEELPTMASMLSLGGTTRDQLVALRERFGLNRVVYTRGSNGSLLVDAQSIDDHGGYPVDLVDSVGAGDAFTATVCMGLLAGWPLPMLNECANRVASFVCSQSGATPELPTSLIEGVSSRSPSI